MPLPLGHAAIGAAVNEILTENQSAVSRLKAFVGIFMLSNLPDIDVVFGLFFDGNGSAYHRGLTHSLAFALLVALIASRAWKVSGVLPKMNFTSCILIVLSHVLADQFLTEASVSLFWPLENNVSPGHTEWGTVFKAVAFEETQDAGIIIASSLFVAGARYLKARWRDSGRPREAPSSGSSILMR